MLRKSLYVTGILVVALLAAGLLGGVVLADPPDNPEQPESGAGGMFRWMDPEMLGQMIQHMTEVHGAEEAARMIQRMNQGEHCHGGDWEGHPMMDPAQAGEGTWGHGMMGGYGDSASGRPMMGRGWGR